ncbi:amidoligase family protein [Amorphus sp. 3PC139-8]|uniref:amidoligase family protein n=1 Tax=Amorphus sp. 3PC139-8 TaxID=2735676 RepID=UPI00345D66DE
MAVFGRNGSQARIAPRDPPWPTGVGGAPRQVGVEVEFAGLDTADVARLVQARLGGEISASDPHRWSVTDTALGTFKIELDSRYAHPESHSGPTDLAMREAFGRVASIVVPTELIAPPIPYRKLPEIDGLVSMLSAAGAQGTTEWAPYAFGLHLNIETPRREMSTILPIFRAFLLVSPWLRRRMGIDPTRALLPFIDPFPTEFVDWVVTAPDDIGTQTFIAAYCEANPSKHRDLDLLPLLASLDAAAVARALGHPQKAVRPAFHYRLPDARLGDPSWSIATEWNRWVRVEELAADPHRLKLLGRAWRRWRAAWLAGEPDWDRMVDKVMA